MISFVQIFDNQYTEKACIPVDSSMNAEGRFFYLKALQIPFVLPYLCYPNRILMNTKNSHQVVLRECESASHFFPTCSASVERSCPCSLNPLFVKSPLATYWASRLSTVEEMAVDLMTTA